MVATAGTTEVTDGGLPEGVTVLTTEGKLAAFTTGALELVAMFRGVDVGGLGCVSFEMVDCAGVTIEGDSKVFTEVVMLAWLIGGPGASAGGSF